MQRANAWIAAHPLQALTLIALVPRLIAAFFSGGYFAHDDHFLIIESAASWVQAADYSTWLPWNQAGEPQPSGHSYFYVGLHYLLFLLLDKLGLRDPEQVMVLVRLLHALWSLVVVRVGYRIALRLGDPQLAWRTGLLLALFYFMPFLAVRNLVEVACIPFLMLAAWRLVRDGENPAWSAALVAGIWAGLAMNVRFQTIFFAAGPGLVFLLQRNWRNVMAYTAGALLPLVVLQGGIDLAIWGRPFMEMQEYIRYNLANTTTYFDQPWYNYLLLLLGMFLVPLGPALLFSFFRRTSPLLLWLPLLLFLAFHSYFPNKQERFLLPMVPLYLVVGHGAWERFRAASAWWQKHSGLWRGSMRLFWVLNTVLLVVLSVSYSKRSRVKAQVMLQDVDVRGMVVEDTAEREAPMPPLFYSGHWNATMIPWTDPSGDLTAELARHAVEVRPNIVLFCGLEELPTRMQRTITAMGPLEIIGVARPGLLDRAVHWLNPVNRNEAIVVARVR